MPVTTEATGDWEVKGEREMTEDPVVPVEVTIMATEAAPIQE